MTFPRLASRLLAALVIGHLALVIPATSLPAAEFKLDEATIADINDAYAKGTLTSEKLTELYLARIAAYDQQGPTIDSVITLNLRALA